MKINIKRVYEKAEKRDGTRILVDRIWPRGLSKAGADIDLWVKDIAPSTELRKWFGHDSEKWPEFKQRYLQELKDKEDALSAIQSELRKGSVTLVYAARDKEHNNAVVLLAHLEESAS